LAVCKELGWAKVVLACWTTSSVRKCRVARGERGALVPAFSHQSPFLSATLPQVGFIKWHKGEQFDVEEYEHYEQVGCCWC